MKNRVFLRALSLLLVSALLALTAPELSLRAQAQSTDDPKAPACNGNIVLGLMVVVVGGIVVVSLYKFCKKHLPPPEPPKPPLVPGQPPCTNCNPQHPSWPCTNCPPLNPKLVSLPSGYSGFALLPLDGTNVDLVDIESCGWTDPFGNPYAIYFHTTVQSTTNLVDWSAEYLVDGYLSFGVYGGSAWMNWPSNAITVTSEPDGSPIATNCSWLPQQQLPLESTVEPRKFYRLTQ